MTFTTTIDRPHLKLARMALWLAAVTVILLTGAMTAPAEAAENRLAGTWQVSVPAGGVTAWVDIEQAGISGVDVSIQVRTGGDASWRDVPLQKTTFGLHGTVGVDPGDLGIRLTATEHGVQAGLNPDVVITVLDAVDHVVTSLQDRVTLSPPSPSSGSPAAGPGAGPASAPAGPGQNGRQAATGTLGRTGVDAGPFVIIGALLLMGGATFVVRGAARGRTGLTRKGNRA